MFITIETEQELLTPWMEELGGDLDPDINPFYAQRVQPGDRVIYKPESQMLIIHRANGTVYSLYRQTNLQADPDEKELSVNWFGHPTPQGETPSLAFENGECYPDCLDGPDKDRLFANFVKMATHEVFNPAGMFLKDGFYPCPSTSMADGFNVSFGQSGQPVMFELANPTEHMFQRLKGSKPMESLSESAQPPIEVTDTTFKTSVFDASRHATVLVECWAAWCSLNKNLTPMLEKIVQTSNGHVRLARLNIDENPEILSQLGIQTIPMVYAFQYGKKSAEIAGVPSENELREFIAALTVPTHSKITGSEQIAAHAKANSPYPTEFFLRGTGELTLKLSQHKAGLRYADRVLKDDLLDFQIERSLLDWKDRERGLAEVANRLYAERLLDEAGFNRILLALAWADGKGHLTPLTSMTRAQLYRAGEQLSGKGGRGAIEKLETVLGELTLEVGKLVADPHLKGDGVVKEIAKLLESGARWLRPEDIADSKIYTTTPGAYHLPLGTLENGATLFYKGEKGLVSIAPPASGKTRCNVLPALASWQGSVVVLDVKGECYAETGHLREQIGDVYKFAPFEPHSSAHFNPLDQISSDPMTIWRDSRLLADALVVKSAKSEPHWDNRARDYLAAMLAYVRSSYPLHEQSMATVLDLVSAPAEDFAYHLTKMAASDLPPLRRQGQALHATLRRSEKMFEGVLETMRGHLSIWEESTLSSITGRSDWNPAQLRERPISVFLTIPPTAVESYASALRVLIAQHVSALMPHDDPHPGKVPVLFLLDEMPRLGRMEPVQAAQDTGRGYGIKLWMFAQHLGQLQAAYGREIAEGMLSSADIQVHMNIRGADAGRISKELGSRETLLDGKSRPLADAVDLSGREFTDYQVLIADGEYPVKLAKRMFQKPSDGGFGLDAPDL